MKKIGIVTGTRADFGLLCRTILLLQSHGDFDTYTFACGTHLSPEYGLTIDELRDSGVENIVTVEMLLSSASKVGVAKSTGLATISFADAFSQHNLDCILLLGDRFETFAAAQAALFLGVPIAHIHGGEVTEGAFDDALRHSISKMADIHFPAAQVFARRLMQLGEQPSRIFVVGAPGIDNIMSAPRASQQQLDAVLTFADHTAPLVLVTYHPVTRGTSAENDITALVDVVKERTDLNFMITYPNADGEGAEMIAQWQTLSALPHVSLCPSLGFKRYLSVMERASCVLGNSSSGVIEAPSFKVPTINIGTRQQGRPKSCTVIDCQLSEVRSALNKALSPEFVMSCQSAENPYGSGNTAKKIVSILADIDLQQLQPQPFYQSENAYE